MKKIRKAIIPAAGYGTRFLPATKAMPKEMLPIVDKPTIQYIVEELVDAGIEQIIIVTGWHKRAIEDHFDRHLELERKLEDSGKIKQLKEIKRISEMADFVYLRQKEARGNGDAILTAEKIIGDEPFIVCWGDDFILSEPSRTKQLIGLYNKYGTNILGCVETSRPEDADKCAFAKGKVVDEGVVLVDELIEKPGLKNKPSDLAVVSGFVFVPEIFDALKKVKVQEGKELVYVDGVNVLREQGIDSYACKIKSGKYYDCGNVLEYLKTNVEFGLKREDIGEDFLLYLKDLINKK